MKNNKKKGFTLMELLIVIAIIVVLVAIAIPVFGGQLQKAKETTDVANIRAEYATQAALVASNDATLAEASTAINEVDLQGTGSGKASFSCSVSSNVLTATYTPTVINGGEDYTWTLDEYGE